MENFTASTNRKLETKTKILAIYLDKLSIQLKNNFFWYFQYSIIRLQYPENFLAIVNFDELFWLKS